MKSATSVVMNETAQDLGISLDLSTKTSNNSAYSSQSVLGPYF